MIAIYFLCRDCAKSDNRPQRSILAQDIAKFKPVMVEQGLYTTLLRCDTCGNMRDKITMVSAIHYIDD